MDSCEDIIALIFLFSLQNLKKVAFLISNGSLCSVVLMGEYKEMQKEINSRYFKDM